jgi:hypothetical protein
VNGFDQSVRPSRDNGKGSPPEARFRLPRFVESRHPEQRTACEMNPEPFTIVPGPVSFIETIGANCAATLRGRVLYIGRASIASRLRVDTRSCGAAIGRPLPLMLLLAAQSYLDHYAAETA